MTQADGRLGGLTRYSLQACGWSAMEKLLPITEGMVQLNLLFVIEVLALFIFEAFVDENPTNKTELLLLSYKETQES